MAGSILIVFLPAVLAQDFITAITVFGSLTSVYTVWTFDFFHTIPLDI
jgi:K+-sensing histidine kinase KdpD